MNLFFPLEYNSLFFLEYNAIFIYLMISLVIAFIFIITSYLFSGQWGGSEKLSPYECGFEPFEDARNAFDIKFYIIAILFIVFDIEVVFLFPWAVSFDYSSSFSFWVVMDFMIELLVGYIYVWNKGVFD
jgi:NADH-quinone oxidoreductase subunit A